MDILDDDREICRFAASVFGGAPDVRRYYDDRKKSHMDILRCQSSPYEGINSYSTVGLSAYSLLHEGKEHPARVELVGACGARCSSYDNILATAAFCVINSKWFCCPTAIFPDVISVHNVSKTLKHLFFTDPFLWNDGLVPLSTASRRVSWLQAVPISDMERAFAGHEGGDKLQELFIAKQIDVFDLNRPSVKV